MHEKLIAALLATLISTLCAISADWANFARYEQANKTARNRPRLPGRFHYRHQRMRENFFGQQSRRARDYGQVTSQMLVRMRRDVLISSLNSWRF
ncbi:MAG: hypothetical protein ACLUKN_13060 [Bacilli bacterium]